MTEIMELDKATSDAMDRLTMASEAYEKKFGEGSLDRVVVHDPTWLDADNFNRGAEKLERAIRKNKPIEPISEELWKDMIF